METMSGNESGTRQLLRRFFTYYQPHRKLFALDFSCAVLSGVLELGFPMAVGLFIDRLLPGQDWGLIIFAAAGLLGVYLLNTGLQAIVIYWGHMLGINMETEMRRKSFDHLQRLSFRYYDNHKTGHLVARVTKDLEEIGEVAHHGPEDLFVAVMTFVGAFVLMFIVNPKLALITALIVPVTGWITTRYGGRMTRTWRALFGRVGEFNARIEENVGGMRVVQAFANEDYERHLFAGDNARYRATKLEAYRIMAASMSLSYLSMRFTQLVVMIAGTYFVLHGELSEGGFISFLLLVGVFFRPVEKINAVLETYPKGIAGFRRYTELLDTEPDIVDAPDAIAVSGLRGDIRYENVTFGYGPEQTVLRDINLFAGTIRENITYGRLDATDDEIEEAARRAKLDTVISGLPDGLDTVIGERGVKLSGGQKQRLAIARMFVKNPPILILDEATSALDSETEQAIQQSLAELSAGRTTLIIAHRLATIQHADRIIVVDESGVAEEGHHDELIAAGGIYRRLHSAQFGTLVV